MPEISVVMPCFNEEEFITGAVRSILSQTRADLEFIIVDDGSTDSSLSILKDFQKQDPRIRLIPADHSGLVAALRAGVNAAVGRFIARMDADDIAYPDRLARQVRALEADASIAAIGSWAREIDRHGNPRRLIQRPTVPEGTGKSPLLHPTAVFRADAYHAVGGYRFPMEAAEDFDLWLRFWDTGYQLRNLPEILLDYRWHGNNASAAQLDVLTARTRALISHAARRTGKPDPFVDPRWRVTRGIPWETLEKDLRATLRVDWARGLTRRVSAQPSVEELAAVEAAIRDALADGGDRSRLGEAMRSLARMRWRRGDTFLAAVWAIRGIGADPRRSIRRMIGRIRAPSV